MLILGGEIRQLMTNLPNPTRKALDAGLVKGHAIGHLRAAKGTSFEEGLAAALKPKEDAAREALKALLEAQQRLAAMFESAFKEVEGWNAGDDIEKAPSHV